MREINFPYKPFFEAVLGATLLTGCAKATRGNETQTPTPFMPEIPTVKAANTPFFPTPEIAGTSTVIMGTESTVPTETRIPPVPFNLFDIDFSDPSKGLTFILNLSADKVFNIISTKPTLDCNENGGFAPKNLTSCVFQSAENPEDLFYLGHSGYWSDNPEVEKPVVLKMPWEDIRHYIEDKYYPKYCPGDKGCKDNELVKQFSPEEKSQRMAEFIGKPIQIIQEDRPSKVLKILGIARIPPDKVEIFDNNRDSLIELLTQIDPNFAKFKIDGTPQIFIVFCGWYNPDEEKNLPPNVIRPNSFAWSRLVFIAGE